MANQMNCAAQKSAANTSNASGDQPESRIVVTGAFSTAEGGDAPIYASYEAGNDFLFLLKRLIDLCKEHGLTEARVTYYPTWGPGDVANEMRLQCGELVVTPGGGFWFVDHPKYGNGYINSRAIQYDDLLMKLIATALGPTDVTFMTDDEHVIECYKENFEEALAPDGETGV